MNLNKMLEETDEKPPEAQGIGHPPNNLKDELSNIYTCKIFI